GLI
ncbi:hypothetical protein D047_3475B, partial [Vibrio parahaemolyticus VPTS-2010_2]